VTLLDTHVLVWAVGRRSKLSRAADSAIARAQRDGGLAISAITLWELAILLARGRIHVYGTVDSAIEHLVEGTTVLPITVEIAALASQFPEDYSRDPADRLIGATARAHGIPLITRDESMRSSPLLKTIW
jgi:PIN domain nuclease of toxin-antitoxin system